MKKKLIPLLLASSALIVSCDQQATSNKASSSSIAPTSNIKKEDAVAVVNGTYISKSTLVTLEKEIEQRAHGQKFPKKQLVEELIQRELLVQDAKQKKLDKSPEIANRLDMAVRSLLSQAVLENYLKANPVTDDELKAKYNKEIAKTSSGYEYKARHILLKEEKQAKDIIEKLSKGAKFEELAKKYSTGPSGSQGGDLGWFIEGQMVEPFSKAVVALKNGEFTKKPVQTKFGWHVILREDSRKQIPPPFDAIKEQLRPELQQKKIQQMLEALRKQAKIEILVSLEEPKAEKPTTITPVSIDDKATEVEEVEKQAKKLDATEATDIDEKEDASKAENVTEKATKEKTDETKK